MKIPTQQENPEGLHQRYIVTKADGTPTDPKAIYFVLRIDKNGSDPEHIHACQWAANTYAHAIYGSTANNDPLRKVADELLELLKKLK